MPAHIKSILDLDDDVMSLVLRKLQMIAKSEARDEWSKRSQRALGRGGAWGAWFPGWPGCLGG